MTITITEELLNRFVDALTYLPYRQVQDIFAQLAAELEEQPEEKPQLITR